MFSTNTIVHFFSRYGFATRAFYLSSLSADVGMLVTPSSRKQSWPNVIASQIPNLVCMSKAWAPPHCYYHAVIYYGTTRKYGKKR
jgi:hypothetical protein